MEDARAAARKSNAAFASSPEGIRRQQAFKEIKAAAKARPAYKGPRSAEDVRNANSWRIRRDRNRAGLASDPLAKSKIKRSGLTVGPQAAKKVGGGKSVDSNKAGVKAIRAFNRQRRLTQAAQKAGLGRRRK